MSVRVQLDYFWMPDFSLFKIQVNDTETDADLDKSVKQGVICTCTEQSTKTKSSPIYKYAFLQATHVSIRWNMEQL